MDALPNLPLKWIPLLAAALAIGLLAGIVPMPMWLVWCAAGIVVIAAAAHLFNQFGGRTDA
jgi:hypothetical protein